MTAVRHDAATLKLCKFNGYRKTKPETGHCFIEASSGLQSVCKPKHFEVLGRRNELTELHLELGADIRKMKDVDAVDHKWRDAISN
ncbi:hypothetical protein OO17_04260 [Rhodopseudomonas palustris]|uniref:Uncharacterized protein n=1 Tax=Rhodopseudomonas palustris TaxID=1076 RepID=A0A0D7F3S4_RHOPL|nr:hypothetical protein OO17_04260 [Rhodopseudomonas palustris]